MTTFKLYIRSTSPFEKPEIKHWARFFYEVSVALNDSLLRSMLYDYTFLAGGAIRDYHLNNSPKDYDIFFKSRIIADSFIDLLRVRLTNGLTKGITFIFESQNTFSIKINDKVVQFCKKKYSGSPEEVISSFDYTNSMAYYDVSRNMLHKSPQFISACEDRVLVFNNKAYSPEIALERYVRFTEEDWTPADDFSFDDLITSSVKSKRSKRGSSEFKGSFDK